MPTAVMISFQAMSATGFWNQLYKFGHFLYLIRHFLPFMLYNRASIATPRIVDFFKTLRENEAKDLPVGTAGFCWYDNSTNAYHI